MATKYAIETVFKMVDQFSSPLSKMGLQGKTVSNMLKNQFRAAEKSVDAMKSKMTELGKNALSKGISAVSDYMKSAINDYIDFDAALHTAGAAFTDINGTGAAFEEQLEGISKTIQKVAGTTEFNATEATNAMLVFAQAGVKSSNAMKLLPKVADMATAAGYSLDEATGVALTSLNAMGMVTEEVLNNPELYAEKLEHLSDIMVYTANSAKMTFGNVGDVIATAGSSFAKLKGGEYQLSAMTTALANLGLTGSEAGTAINAMMNRLTNNAGQTNLKKIGINPSDLIDTNGDMKSIDQVVDLINSKLEGEGSFEKLSYLNAIFGTNGMKAAEKLLATGGDSLREFMNAAENAGGSVVTQADQIRGSIGNMIKLLQSGISAVAFQVIEGLKSRGIDLVKSLQSFVENFNPKPIVDGLILIWDTISGLAKVVWTLRVPIMIVVSAILLFKGAMIAALIVTQIYCSIMTTWKFLAGVVKGIQLAYNATLWGTTAAIEGNNAASVGGRIGMFLYAAATKVAAAAQFLFGKAVSGIKWMKYVAGLVAAKAALIAHVIAMGVAKVAMVAFTVATTAATAATGFLNAVFIASPIGWIVLAIAAAIALVVAGIILLVKHWDTVTAAFKVAWEAIKGFFASMWEYITGFFSMAREGILSFVEMIKNAIQPLADFFLGFIGNVINYWQALVAVFQDQGLIGALAMIGKSIISFILLPIESVLNLLSNIPVIGDTFAQWRDSVAAFRDELSYSGLDSAGPITERDAQRINTETFISESNSNANVTIGLERGLVAQVSGPAPGITIEQYHSGGF